MDFGRDELYSEEEEHTSHHKGKLPFSYCSSTCQSSSSSPYKPQQLMGYASGPWDPQIDHMGSWLSTKYDLEEEDNSRLCSEGVAAKHDFMEVSPVNEEDVRRVDSNSSSSALDLSRNTGQGASVSIQKEHMFDKVVTPSDVGKLNRLVIPKQHAEKYFPLHSSSNEKGLLLNFEDRNGKPWRFRYSYWNSSQSYVMTKGWSRFVKEKKLDAGDIVSFQRGIGELGKDRLFIDWRRRPDAPAPPSHFPFHRTIPWSPLLLRPQPAALARENHFHLSRVNNINRSSYYGGYSYDGGVVNPAGAMGSVVYLRSATAPLQVGRGMVEWQQQQPQQQQHPMVFDSVPVVHGKAAAKRLRLFGVNMDCPISDQSEECDMLSSSSATMEPHQLSSSSPHSLQLRLYNGTPLLPRDYLNKGKSSTSTDSDM